MSRDKRPTEEILRSAIEAIESGDIESLSMKAIADAAGMSRQGLYLHYESRAELVLAIVQYADHHYNIERELRPLRSATSGDAILTAVARFHGRYHARIYKVARFLHWMRVTDEAAELGWQDRLGERRNGARLTATRLHEWNELAPGWTVSAAGDWIAAQGTERTYEDLVLSMGWSQRRYASMLEDTYKRVLLKDYQP